MSDGFEEAVRTARADAFDAAPDEASTAARKAAAFREEIDEDLTGTLVAAVEAADDYDSFAPRDDLAVGELAASDVLYCQL